MTIVEAEILGIAVVVLFLETPRAASRPILANPVSLVGPFAVLAMLGSLWGRLGAIQQAFMITIRPPPTRGIGTGGGFESIVLDRAG